MALDAAAAGMMALGGVDPPTADEFRVFLQKIKDDVQVTDFIQVVEQYSYEYAPQGYYAQQQQLQSAPIPPVYPPSGAMVQLRDTPQKPGAAGAPGGFVPLAERECFKCGQKGHIAAKCTAK